MATYYTDNSTRLEAKKKGSPGFAGNKKIGITETYEAATLAVGSTLAMFKPPRGAKWDGTGFLAWDDLSDTAAYTLSVGVGVTKAGAAAVVDAFLAATSVVSAADMAALDAGAAAITYIGYEFDGETYVTITTAGAAADATGTIKLSMGFEMP